MKVSEFSRPFDVPIHILKKYRDVEPNGKLLPMYCNSDVNLSLKKIAAICGIERRIVFHAARHTYATEITLSHRCAIGNGQQNVGTYTG